MKQNIEIEVPYGFEAKYDPETMLVKIIKKDDKPRSWEEYLEQNPNADGKYWYDDIVQKTIRMPDYTGVNRGVNRCNRVMYFSSKEECNAFIALARLRQLREAWIDGWKPDFLNADTKWCIIVEYNKVRVSYSMTWNEALSFPTEEMANEFMNCFKDLLETAKPLI